MAPKSKLELDKEKLKNLLTNKSQIKHERQKLIDLGKSLTVKTKSQEVTEEWNRCCYLSKNLPDETMYEVRNGALTKHIDIARRNHIFLSRNVVTNDLRIERRLNHIKKNELGLGLGLGLGSSCNNYSSNSSGLGGDSGAVIVKRWRKIRNKKTNFHENKKNIKRNRSYLGFNSNNNTDSNSNSNSTGSNGNDKSDKVVSDSPKKKMKVKK